MDVSLSSSFLPSPFCNKIDKMKENVFKNRKKKAVRKRKRKRGKEREKTESQNTFNSDHERRGRGREKSKGTKPKEMRRSRGGTAPRLSGRTRIKRNFFCNLRASHDTFSLFWKNNRLFNKRQFFSKDSSLSSFSFFVCFIFKRRESYFANLRTTKKRRRANWRASGRASAREIFRRRESHILLRFQILHQSSS